MRLNLKNWPKPRKSAVTQQAYLRVAALFGGKTITSLKIEGLTNLVQTLGNGLDVQ